MSTTPSPTAGRRRPTGLLWLSRVAWRNPLARGSDRAEAAFGVIVFVLWLLALPIVATAGSMCWPQIAAVADEEQRARHQTTAVLTTEAADFVFSDHGVPMTSQIPVSARWIAPDGSARSGPINTQSGAKAGDVRTIWVDSTGGVTDPPLTRGKAAFLLILAAVGCWLTQALLLTGAWLTVRCWLNRRRLAAWEHDWQHIEPVWSGRHP